MSSFCPKCGTKADDNQLFCASCGTPLQAAQPTFQPFYDPNATQVPQGQPYVQNAYQAPQGQPYMQNTYQAPQGQPYMQNMYQPNQGQYYNGEPEMPMNWFKFVIFFQLFAAAVLNVVNALALFSEIDELETYRGAFSAMNTYIDNCSTANTIMAIIFIVLSVYAIFTRFQLAGYKKIGPTLYLSYLGIVAAANLLYIISIMSFADALFDSMGGQFGMTEVSSYITQIIMNVVLLIGNIIYFKKRKALFVK